MLSIISAVIVISVLVFVHELGHFTFAKLFNVKVLVFSLGFGPALLKKKAGETEYRISALPLGGYVKMLGESYDDEEPVPEEDRTRSYATQANWKKLLILVAGPLSNWVFAFLMLLVVFLHGVPYLTTKVGDVKDGSPAYSAGILRGDRIMEIDGVPVKEWDDMKKIIVASRGREIRITIDRDGRALVVRLVPVVTAEKDVFGDTVRVPVIGITPYGDFGVTEGSTVHSLVMAYRESLSISSLVVVSLVKLIEGRIPAKDLGGPILIAQQAAHQAKRGIVALLYFTALIGINFAILNILPIPVLDGGNVVFTLIETAIRRPLNKRVKLVVMEFGVLFIILLTVFAFYNDISRIIVSHH
ncbi:MAG: RIP metalloprotease RseP [Deltaproteobacteria bacterium]|nr:RIP metalloprotease RseP [Deltaproteobacteria bacterium]MCL5276504.1 RIP metalloprotease RseP [Deltaproteobacteria bacterium]